MRHISLSLCGSTPWYSNLFQYSTHAARALGLRSMMLTTRGSGAPVRWADSIILRSPGGLFGFIDIAQPRHHVSPCLISAPTRPLDYKAKANAALRKLNVLYP